MKQLFVFLSLLAIAYSDCPNGSLPIPELPGECWIFVKQSDDEVDQYFACLSRGAYLISIHNTIQNNVIAQYSQKYFGNITGVYLGMEYLHVGKELGWSWYDGTPMDYLKWAAGEPKPSATCVHLNPIDTNWYSDGCMESHPTICRMPQPLEPKKQILRPNRH